MQHQAKYTTGGVQMLHCCMRRERPKTRTTGFWGRAFRSMRVPRDRIGTTVSFYIYFYNILSFWLVYKGSHYDAWISLLVYVCMYREATCVAAAYPALWSLHISISRSIEINYLNVFIIWYFQFNLRPDYFRVGNSGRHVRPTLNHLIFIVKAKCIIYEEGEVMG